MSKRQMFKKQVYVKATSREQVSRSNCHDNDERKKINVHMLISLTKDITFYCARLGR